MRWFLLLLFSLSLQATATRSVLQTFTQSDGSTFEGRLKGDAFMHWVETTDGTALIFNKKSATFEYAVIRDSDLVRSGIPYDPQRKRRSIGTPDTTEIMRLWQERHHR